MRDSTGALLGAMAVGHDEGDTCLGREPSAQWHSTVIAFAIPLRAVPQRDEAGDSSSREAASGEQ